MGKNMMDKLKEGVSVQEVEDFARKHAIEVVSASAIIIGSISSMFDFFTGPAFSILFATIGIILGIFFPIPVEKGLRQIYGFTFKQEKTTQMILGAVAIVVAIFIPFLLFGVIGLLAGTAYHYYTRHAQSNKGETKSPRSHTSAGNEEHD